MPDTPLNPSSLDTNRTGELSVDQRRGFGALSRSNRRSALSSAAYLIAGAVLVGFFASPTASPALRTLVMSIALALAAFLIVRAITGSDALTRDVRRGQVASVEGAIGKHRMSGKANVDIRFIDVGDERFKVSRGTYEAAPDAGLVRLYFLPHSRKVVNLERLPDSPRNDITMATVAELLGATLKAHAGRERNEARAELAAVGDVLRASFTSSPAPASPGIRDPRPLGEAILGTWTNSLMTLSFAADGSVTIHMPGATKGGRWSVDDAGRLRADITGLHETADAWVASNQLTIAVEGEGLIFTRGS